MNSSYLKKHVLTFFTILSVLFLSGCGIFNSDNNDDFEDGTVEGARFHLSMDKTVVERGGSFLATFTVENTTNRTLEIETECVELAGIGVYQGDELMDFRGAFPGCLTALGYFEIEPTETLTLEWDVDAFTLSSETGEAPFDTTYVEPGDYVLRAEANVSRINGTEVEVESREIEFRVN